MHSAVGADERRAEKCAVAGFQHRIGGGVDALDVAERNWRAALDDLTGELADRRRPRAERRLRLLAVGSADDELVAVEQADGGRVRAYELRRLRDDLLQDRVRIELARE